MIEDNYIFIAKLNPRKKHAFLILESFFGFIIFLSLDNHLWQFIEACITIFIIIFTLTKINNEDNVLIFFENKIEFRNKNKTATKNYEELNEVCFFYLSKDSFTRLTFFKKKYDVNIEMKNGLDFKKEDFILFILNKPEKILVNERSRFEKIKYFIHKGELRHVKQN